MQFGQRYSNAIAQFHQDFHQAAFKFATTAISLFSAVDIEGGSAMTLFFFA